MVCIWGSLVKFQGGGVVLKTRLRAKSVDLQCFFTRTYPCLSKLSDSLRLRGVCVWLGVMLLHRHRAMVCVWGSLVKFQGVGLLQSLMCFRTVVSLFVL